VWLVLFVPFVRLRIGNDACNLSKGASVFWLIPIRLVDRTIAAIDLDVWRVRNTTRIALGVCTATRRTLLWTFPGWINVGKLREETEAAAQRLAVILRRDLRRFGPSASAQDS
jgi:hypothetical protein